jgi:hypothetical protein
MKALSFPATSPLLSLVCRQGRCVLLIVTLLLRNTQRPHQLCTNLQQHLLGDVAGKKFLTISSVYGIVGLTGIPQDKISSPQYATSPSTLY